jgi:hypothetical protein
MINGPHRPLASPPKENEHHRSGHHRPRKMSITARGITAQENEHHRSGHHRPRKGNIQKID